MQHSTNKPFAEQLHSLTSVGNENTNKANFSNEKLSTFEQIPFTPFFVIGDEEKGYAAVMGQYRITDPMVTKELVIEYVNAQPYELLITIMSAIFEILHKNKSQSILESTKEPTKILTQPSSH